MHRRSRKSSSSLRIAGVQWSSTIGNALWSMVPGVAVVLGIVLGLADIASASCGSSGWRGRCCGGYRPPGVAWRRSEGPTGQGLILAKAGAASEGRAHAVRGLRGRESTKKVWGVGSIVAGAVPSTSCTASQVPTVSSQRPK